MPNLFAREWRNLLFGFAFGVTLLLGGGGTEGPALNGLIAALGAILLGTIVADQVTGLRALPALAIIPVGAILAVLLIALVQVVPVPASTWQRLPGRETVSAALKLVGASGHARAISIDPAATVAWTTALLMPSAILLHITRASARTLRIFLAILIGCSVLSGLVGAMQLALGHPEILSFYDGPSRGAASGLFANPNHQGLMMVLGLIAVAAFPLARKRSRNGSPDSLAVSYAVMAFFALMAIASGSRASLALLCGALPIALLLRLEAKSILRWAAGLGVALAIMWLVVVLYPGTNQLAVRESFRMSDDLRAAYYPDLVYTLWQYWPAGSGLGTFASAFPPNENLDIAGRAYLNHAHNDFLELLIESGAMGAIVLVATFAAAGLCAAKRLLNRDVDRRLIIGAIVILIACAIHSFGDYPLRTSAIAAIAALALGILFNRPSPPRVKSGRPASAWLFALIVLASVPIALETMRLDLVASSLREERIEKAAALGSRDALVLGVEADALLKTGNARGAEKLAAQAVIRQPMNSAGLDALARAREAQGKPAAVVWQVASLLGWRDPATQYWAVQQALRANQPGVAAVRADAVMRTSEPTAQFVRGLRIAANDRGFRTALAERLKLEPNWAQKFFAVANTSSLDELKGVFTIFAQIAGRDSSGDEAHAAPLIASFMARRDFGSAVRTYELIRPNRSNGDELITDSQFTRNPDDYAHSTMFDWRLLGDQSTSVSIDASPPSRLIVDTAAERSRIVADLHLPLARGNYVLSYRYRSDEGGAVRLQLTCLGRPALLADEPVDAAGTFTSAVADIKVPEACPMSKLSIETRSADKPAVVEFDQVSLKWLR